jgi:predicted ester cyclase
VALALDLAGIDSAMTPDARIHELEAMEYPRGREGFKCSGARSMPPFPMNIFIRTVRFEEDDTVQVDLEISATHTGAEFMGIRATGRKIHFDVHARTRFVDGKIPNAGSEFPSNTSSGSS